MNEVSVGQESQVSIKWPTADCRFGLRGRSSLGDSAGSALPPFARRACPPCLSSSDRGPRAARPAVAAREGSPVARSGGCAFGFGFSTRGSEFRAFGSRSRACEN